MRSQRMKDRVADFILQHASPAKTVTSTIEMTSAALTSFASAAGAQCLVVTELGDISTRGARGFLFDRTNLRSTLGLGTCEDAWRAWRRGDDIPTNDSAIEINSIEAARWVPGKT